MSNELIRRAAVGLVRSKAFLDTMEGLVAAELDRQLRSAAGGESIYIAKTSGNRDKKTRNELIRERFKGDNHDELAQDFGLSPRQIRRITKK